MKRRRLRRALLLTGVVVVLACGSSYWRYRHPAAPRSLDKDNTGTPTECAVVHLADGREYPVVAGRFTPPYVPRRLARGARFDPSSPLEVLDAIQSFAAVDWPAYLDLTDADLRRTMVKIDEDAKTKGAPPPTPLPDDAVVPSYTHWVEFRRGSRVYRMFCATSPRRTARSRAAPSLS